MSRRFLPLILLASLGLSWESWSHGQTSPGLPDASASRHALRDLKQRLALVAADKESRFGAGSLKLLEDKLQRKLTPSEQHAYTRTDEGSWKVYEDDWIRFEYPDEPLLTVDVVDPKTRKPIKVIGGVASMADNSFERAYWLKVGELHYGVILVKEADWLDEGICLCGPIAYKKCVLEGGTMLEFSLLPNGDIKKVQALGAKHRAMLFEWTHSVITQEAYARLGGSLRMKVPGTKTLSEWHAYSKTKRGWEGIIPWLESGDPADKVTSLLGEPTGKQDGQWHYALEKWAADGSGHKYTFSIKMDQGKFAGVDADWQKWEKLPFKHGTIAWARERLQLLSEDDVPQEKKDSAKLTDMAIMVDLVLKQAPAAKRDAWSALTEIARDMANLGWKDDRIGSLIAKRYDEQGLSHFYCIDLLEAYDVKDRHPRMTQRLSRLVALAEDRSGEINNLLASIDAKTPGYANALNTALNHKLSDIRRTAYNFAVKLPRTEALAALKKGIDDPDSDARVMAALSINEVVISEDLPWLQKKLDAAKDKEMKEALQRAIDAAREKQ